MAQGTTRLTQGYTTTYSGQDLSAQLQFEQLSVMLAQVLDVLGGEYLDVGEGVRLHREVVVGLGAPDHVRDGSIWTTSTGLLRGQSAGVIGNLV